MAKAAPVVGSRSRRVLVVAGAVVGGLAVLIALASVAEHVMFSGSVLPGVRIEGMHVAGKKDADVARAIQQLSAQLDATPIRTHAGDHDFVVEPSLINFSVDADATARAARDAGRGSNPLAIVADTVLRRFRPNVVHLVVHYDSTAFEGLLDGWTSAVQTGLVQGGLRFEGTTVVPIAPHTGRGLLRAEAQRSMQALLSSGSRPDLALPLGAVAPTIDQAAVNAAAAKARALLTGTYVVHAGTATVTLTPAQIAPTLGTTSAANALDLTIDPTKLHAALGPAVAAVEQPPVDATFDTSNVNAVTVVPSRDGRELDTAAVGNAILAGQRSITATIGAVHPAHDTKWAQSLGINYQVSSFTTYYEPGEARVHNIHLAADVLNNTIVLPGQTFSLNAKLGQRTPQKGYVEAPIEVEDGFSTDYGGGISQLTTTLYNAVFFGGYVDVDHSPHHYYVSRYPLGREATIVWPYVDLKFRDDTKHGVLIRAYYSATSVTVTFFGNTDGRHATEANRKILKTVPITNKLVPCPAKNPMDDPDDACAHLAPGVQDAVLSGETGYDVEFDRVITQPGRPTITQHYQVHYPMLQNTVLVGAATTSAPTTTSTTAPGTGAPTPTTAPQG